MMLYDRSLHEGSHVRMQHTRLVHCSGETLPLPMARYVLTFVSSYHMMVYDRSFHEGLPVKVKESQGANLLSACHLACVV